MSKSKKVKSALISVFHKDGLEPIVKKLDELGVRIYSTGGTEKFTSQHASANDLSAGKVSGLSALATG